VFLGLPWLLVRPVPGRPAADSAWMPHPCRKNSVNASSTPYAGRLRGRAAGLMRPAGQAVRPWPSPASCQGRQAGRLGTDRAGTGG